MTQTKLKVSLGFEYETHTSQRTVIDDKMATLLPRRETRPRENEGRPSHTAGLMH
jgi:hypothetical protein